MKTEPARHLDGPRIDRDGYMVGEIEVPGGLPPEEPEIEDRERE